MKEKVNKILKFLLQEKFLFLLATLFTLIPVLVFRFFPTMDGAAHLYNSNLLNEIIFGSNEILSDFFVLNHKPVPNLTGHVILSFFNLFLPAFLAEKMFLTCYVVGLCYSYRRLVKSISSDSLASYFIFPFVYSFVFILGFYNFSIALVFLFLTLSYWIRNESKSLGIKQIIVLFLLLSVAFFSHIFVFAILLMSLGILFITRIASNFYGSTNNKKEVLKNSLKKLGPLLISVLIPFALFVHYFYSRPPANKIGYLPAQELKENLYNFRSILSYNSNEEYQYIEKIGYVFLLLLIVTVLVRLRKLIVNYQLNKKIIGLFQHKDLWLLIGIILLVMYFFLPDSTSYGGFITTRVSLILYLIIMLWISAHKIPKIISVLMIGVVFYSHFFLVTYYTSLIKNLNEIAKDCNEAGKIIEPNSVILPLNYSQEWLALHFSNYMGIEKPMVILDNYEAVNDYFPLIWNWPHLTSPIYDNIAENNFLCMDSSTYLNQANYKVDYIFVLDDINNKEDECRDQKKKELLELTELVFENNNCKVYKFKTTDL